MASSLKRERYAERSRSIFTAVTNPFIQITGGGQDVSAALSITGHFVVLVERQ